MGQVIIRNIDDRVVERLKARAMAQRKSLEQSMTPPHAPGMTYPTAEDLVREDRDTR